MITKDKLYEITESNKTEISAGLWEEKSVFVFENRIVEFPKKICKHAKKTECLEKESVWEGNKFIGTKDVVEVVYIFPRVLIALNEGGYNSTGVCLDCLLEELLEKDMLPK